MNENTPRDLYDRLADTALLLIEYQDAGDQVMTQVYRAEYDRLRVQYDAEQIELRAWMDERQAAGTGSAGEHLAAGGRARA